MSPSDLLATPVLNAFQNVARHHHWETKQTKLLRSMSKKVPSSEVTKWFLRYFQRLNRFANIFRKWLTRKQNKQNTFKLKLKVVSAESDAAPSFSTANGEHPSTPRHQGLGGGLYIVEVGNCGKKGWEKEGRDLLPPSETKHKGNPPTTPLSHNVAHATYNYNWLIWLS